MSQTLDKINEATAVAEIAHFGEKIILPEKMTMPQAIRLLERREAYLEEDVEFVESFNVFPWDGAYALQQVLIRTFGWAPTEPTETMFGKQPPRSITIETGFGTTAAIPWGKMSLPGFGDSMLYTWSTTEKDMIVFAVTIKTKRKYEPDIRKLLHEIRVETEQNSLYRGKAIKVRFLDDDGGRLPMPKPEFIDTQNINPDHVIYAAAVQEQIETNLYTPISRVKDCLDNNIPVKRGILLGGTYGTGKTLAAKVASKLATDNGLTYLYVPRADELSYAIKFAQQYQSPACVIFCEDIDREMAGSRSVEMDDILNVLDGIDTKYSNVIVVMTSNDLTNINPAMLRPGRLDAVIEVTPPDTAATIKLLRMYGDGSIADTTDLSAAAEELEGAIPAVVAEVVKRAKLAQLSMQPPGTAVTDLSEAALIKAAQSMGNQLRLLKARTESTEQPVTIDKLLQNVVSEAQAPGLAMVKAIHGRVM